MHRSLKPIILVLVLLAAASPLLVMASNSDPVWTFDSVSPDSVSDERSSARQVYLLIMGQVAAWNSQNIEGFMSAYWRSPKLVYLDDGQQIFGWDQLYANYLNGFSDRSLMGYLEAQRVKVQMLEPDMAYVLLWWDMLVGRPRSKVVGTSTLVVRRLDNDWKIVASHTTSLQP
jgi:uncharacterized protein (TIGR02246 family)